MYLAIGAPQLILLSIVPIGIFILGYALGKKAGYIKRVKETENKALKE
ncbi:hypothetical protein [Maribacter sp. 4G9]|nr:hypothetical protein [Maribacter sp. 4G9]